MINNHNKSSYSSYSSSFYLKQTKIGDEWVTNRDEYSDNLVTNKTNKTIMTNNIDPTEKEKRKKILDEYSQKQDFRVSCGIGKWVKYTGFKEEYRLREILDDEVVIEFDSDDLDRVMMGISATSINMWMDGIHFQQWDHNGRSPHLHIKDLPITQLTPKERKIWKETFVKHYVPKEYHNIVDLSLCGIHLIRMEWSPCWKGKYKIKKLVGEYGIGK